MKQDEEGRLEKITQRQAKAAELQAHPERDFFIDSQLVPVHFIIEIIRWTGLAPWGFGFPFPGSLYLPC